MLLAALHLNNLQPIKKAPEKELSIFFAVLIAYR